MAHMQKPDFVFWRNGWVYLNQWGCQFSRLLAAEVCASAVVLLDTPCSEVVWRVLATHSIRQFPLHIPSRASLCAITFQLESTCCFTPRKTACVTHWIGGYVDSRAGNKWMEMILDPIEKRKISTLPGIELSNPCPGYYNNTVSATHLSSTSWHCQWSLRIT